MVGLGECSLDHVVFVGVTGSGRDQKVLVDFGAIGRKTVYARYLHGSDDGLN